MGENSLNFEFFKEAAKLQEDYKTLVESKTLTKKALCVLCVPFRDKDFLSDSETLRIARKEMELSEMVVCIQRRMSRESV